MLSARTAAVALRLAFAAVALAPAAADALDISDRYRSPRNRERKVRTSTALIVLHTTEAPEGSSLRKLSDRGEAHFCVTESGRIFRIVDRDREAFHAGRSMWNGRENVDNFSIGIECVGHHDKPMPAVQLAAIKSLVKELQSMYRLPDDKVVCHSHVAYGAPNRWHKAKHRGRKRCGMLFAMPSVRARLGLKSRPGYDADVRARRLVVGDEYLRKVLYGSVDTMRGNLGAAPAETSGGGFFGLFSKSRARPAAETAAPAVKPNPRPAIQASPPKSVSDLKARGYVMRGVVSKSNSASKIAGSRWNAPDTYYTIRNKVISGSNIDQKRIERGMSVWTRAKGD